jgi:protease-4
MLQSGVDSMYARFLNVVATARHKTPQQVDEIAQGRVWDGGTAHQLGLVDGFGGIDDAVAKAAQLAGLGNERRVRYLEPPVSFRQQLIETLASDGNDNSAVPEDAFASLTRAPQQQLAQVIGQVRSILGGASIQARCLECPPVAPARLDKSDLSLLALIKEWLA